MKSNFFSKFFFSKKSKQTIDDDTMAEIMEIEHYFNDPHLKNFVQNFESILSKKSSDHYFTTLGINFHNESVASVKFYAHVLEEMTHEEVCLFLPVSDDYMRYIPFKSIGTIIDKKHVGTILEIKFKPKALHPTFGFFYILNNNENSYKEIGYPLHLPEKIKQSSVSLGINFEYSGNETFSKRYYYYNTIEDKTYFEERFGIPLLGDFLEYAEGDDVFKLNNYSGVIPDFWKKDKNFSDKERNIIRYLTQKYNLSVIGYGKYENKPTRAIYFREGHSEKKTLQNMLIQYSNVFKTIVEK